MNLVIVDDDPIAIYLAKHVFEKNENITEITTFIEPEKGLNYFFDIANHNKDICLILDLNMPKIDGWEFLKQLDETNTINTIQSLKIFICSSSIFEKDKIKANSYSFVSGFIEKPISKSANKIIES